MHTGNMGWEGHRGGPGRARCLGLSGPAGQGVQFSRLLSGAFRSPPGSAVPLLYNNHRLVSPKVHLNHQVFPF